MAAWALFDHAEGSAPATPEVVDIILYAAAID